MRNWDGAVECRLEVSPLGVKVIAPKEEFYLPVRYSSRTGSFVRFHQGVSFINRRYLYGKNCIYAPGVVFGVEDYGNGAILAGEKLYVVKEVVRVGAPEEESKEDPLKVYETPQKTVDIFVRMWVERTKRVILSRIKDPVLRKSLEETPIKDTMKFLEERWEEVKKAGVGLSSPPVLLVFDPQAGSGKAMLSAFDRYGVRGYLYGVELRKIRQEDPRYRVRTGIDTLAFISALQAEGLANYDGYGRLYIKSSVPQWFEELCRRKNVPVQTARRALANMVYFMNPPYIAGGRHPIVEETFNSFPPVTEQLNRTTFSGSGFVVASHVHKNILEHSYSDMAVDTLPYQEVGYDYPTPSHYMVGFVRKGQTLVGERGPLHTGTELFSDEWWLRMLEDCNALLPIMDELMERLEKTALEVQKRVQESDLREILRPFSLYDLALQGKPVFPALHLLDNRLLTFDELLYTPLPEIYRKRYPELYELVLRVANARGVRLPEGVTENYAPLEFKLQGFMKYAYVPMWIELNEKVKEVLLSLVPEELRKEVQVVLEYPQAKEVWIKSAFSTVTSAEGDIAFGTRNYLVLTDGAGRSLAILPVSVSDFYDRLIQEGIIEPTLKSVWSHPEAKTQAVKLLENFVAYMKASGLFTGEEKSLIANLVQSSGGAQLHKSLYQLSAKLFHEWSKEGRLLRERVLGQDIYQNAVESALEALRSMGISKASAVREILEDMRKLYRDSEYLFLSCLQDVREEEKPFVDMYTGGMSIKEYLKSRLEQAGLDQTASEGVASAFVSTLDPYASLVLSGRIAQSVRKAVYAYAYALMIEGRLKEGKYEEALDLFEELFVGARLMRKDGSLLEVETLGFIPYQFRYGLEMGLLTAIEYMNGRPANAILGMAPRSGKTLSALLQGFVFHLLTGQKFYMGVRSVNFFDIVTQCVEFIPFMAERLTLSPSSVDEDKVPGEFLGSFINPWAVLPNPFYKTAELLFREGGDGVRKALEKDGLGLLENFIEKPSEELLKYARTRPYGAVLGMGGFSQQLKQGLACYLAYLEKEGYFKPNADWKKVLSDWARLSQKVEEDQKRQEDRPTPFVVFSKDGHMMAMNYRVRYDRKEIAPGCYANADVRLERVEELPESGYYVITPRGMHAIRGRFGDEVLTELSGNFIKAGTAGEQEIYLIKQEVLFEYLDNEFLELQAENLGIVRAERFIKDLYIAFEEKGTHLRDFKGKYEISTISMGRLEFPFVVPFFTGGKGDLKVFAPPSEHLTGSTLELSSSKLRYTYVYSREAPPFTRSSQSNARPFIYLSSALEGSQTIFDEADRGLVEDSSGTFRLMAAMAQNPRISLTVMSGTITNGQVAMPAGIAMLLSGAGIDAAISYAQKMQEIYGIRQIKGVNEGFFIKLLEVYDRLFTEGGWETFTEELLERGSLPERVEFLIEKADEMGMLTPEEESALHRLYRELMKVEEERRRQGSAVPKKFLPMVVFFQQLNRWVKEHELYSSGEFLHVLLESMEDAGIIQDGVGTGDLVGFALSLAGLKVPSVFGNSETLRGVKERGQVLDAVDMEQYRRTREWPFEYSSESIYGGLKVLSGVEAISKVVDEGLFRDLSRRVGRENLRALVDSLESDRVSLHVHLFEDYLLVVEKLEKHLRTQKGYEGIVSASGKTTRDNLVSVVEDLIKHRESSAREEKVEFARKVIDALSRAQIRVIEEEEKRQEGRNMPARKKLEISVKIDGKTQTFSLYGEELRTKPALLDLLLKDVPKTDLNVVLDLAEGRGWKAELFKDKNPSYPVRVNLVFSQFEEVVDSICNRGLRGSLEETVKSGMSGVLLTSRVDTLPVVLGDLLSDLLEHKPEGQQVQVLLLVKDERVRGFVNRLDLEYLRSRGILLKAETSQGPVEKDLMAFRAARARHQEPPQTFVLAPMQSVARGVDFSGLDRIIAYGVVGGAEAVQLSYRGSNPVGQESPWIRFGTPVRALTTGRGKSVMFGPSFTCIRTQRAIHASGFSSSLLTGKGSKDVERKVVYLDNRLPHFVKEYWAAVKSEMVV